MTYSTLDQFSRSEFLCGLWKDVDGCMCPSSSKQVAGPGESQNQQVWGAPFKRSGFDSFSSHK